MNGWWWRGTGALTILLLLGGVLAWAQSAEREKGPGGVEERRLLYAMQQERARLEAEFRQKEEKLALKEIELKTLAAEVDKKLEEIKTLRQSMMQEIDDRDESEEARVKELSRMYEKMDPAQAAGRMANLEEELAVRILAGMKAKSAGRLLDAMEPGRAARLSAVYATLPKESKRSPGAR